MAISERINFNGKYIRITIDILDLQIINPR